MANPPNRVITAEVVPTEPPPSSRVMFQPVIPLVCPGKDPGAWNRIRRWEYALSPGGHLRALLRWTVLVVIVLLIIGGAACVVLPVFLVVAKLIAEIAYNLMMGAVYLVCFLVLAAFLAGGK